MVKNQLQYEQIQPQFEIGDLVYMKGNNEIKMVIENFVSDYVFAGRYQCAYFDRVKLFNADGTAVEQTKKKSISLHQNVLELAN